MQDETGKLRNMEYKPKPFGSSSEGPGIFTSALLLGAAGTVAGLIAGELNGDKEATPLFAMGGLGLGLGASGVANAIGAIAASRPRSLAEQRAYEASSPTLKNLLVPGVAAYNLGQSMGWEESRRGMHQEEGITAVPDEYLARKERLEHAKKYGEVLPLRPFSGTHYLTTDAQWEDMQKRDAVTNKKASYLRLYKGDNMTYADAISAMRKTAAPGGAYLNRMAQPIRKEDVPVSSAYANPEAVKELAQQKMGPAYSPTALDITGGAARGMGSGYADIFRRGNADVANAGSAAAKGIASGVNAIGPFLRRHNPFMSPETRISLAKETFGPKLTPEQLAAKQQAVEAGKGVDAEIAAGNAQRAVEPYIQEAVYNAGVPGTLLRSQLRADTMNQQMDNAVSELSADAKATLEAQQKQKIRSALGIGGGAAAGGVAGYGLGSLLSKNRGVRLLSGAAGAGLGGYAGHLLTKEKPPVA